MPRTSPVSPAIWTNWGSCWTNFPICPWSVPPGCDSYHPDAIRDFFIKYQDRILFGSDIFLIADEKTLQSETALKTWRQRQIRAYSDYLEYFETDHSVTVPGGYQSQWLRLKGIHLPPTVLEKFYHRNAERLIPGSAPALSSGRGDGASAAPMARGKPPDTLVK